MGVPSKTVKLYKTRRKASGPLSFKYREENLLAYLLACLLTYSMVQDII
jgi:hypothetical protein